MTAQRAGIRGDRRDEATTTESTSPGSTWPTRIRASHSHADPEAGSILVMALASLAVAAALIATVAVASALYLDRKELLAIADATAAHAATSLSEEQYLNGTVTLTNRGVLMSATEFLAATPTSTGSVVGLGIGSPTGAINAVTAQVTVTGYSRPSFIPWALAPWSDGIAITVTATAQGG